jgi:tetratricopeptide (TPR) repeat protein
VSAKAKQVVVQRKIAEAAGNDDTRTRNAHRLELEKIRAEAADLTKFCKDPLNETNDVFLPFQPVHQKVDFTRWFSATTPDTHFPYYEPTSKEKDAQYVRLALQFYRQGKFALAIRTLDFFAAEHPKSEYKTEMRFLRANALIKLGLNAEADQILQALMSEQRNTPVALHSGMFMAMRLVTRKSYLAALESFMWLSQHYPSHNLNWVFHLGAAESLYALRQTERAVKEYQWVVDNAPERAFRAEGSVRIGDLYLSRFQYEQALAAYYEAATSFPKESKGYAPLAINRAEALYGLGQFDRAQAAFTAFLKDFASNPAGWRATFRLGEIASRVAPQTPASAKLARTWYYDTVNRFPMTPGATLARLRLAPCEYHGGFDATTADAFFYGDAAAFTGLGEVSLARYRDLRALAHVRTLIALGEEDEAVDTAIDEINATMQVDQKIQLGRLVAKLVRSNVLNLLEKNKKYQALRFFHEKESWVKPVHAKDPGAADTDYLLKLSQAAADLGLGKLSSELASTYRGFPGLSGSPNDLRAPAADEPPADLDRRLRQSEQAYTEARSIWASAAKVTPETEARVRALLARVAEESPFSYHREILLGLTEERAGRAGIALGHAVRAQLLMPSDPEAGRDLSVEGWLAALESKAGEPKLALEIYRTIEGLLETQKRAPAAEPEVKVAKGKRPPPATRTLGEMLGLPAAPSLETAILAQAEILEKAPRKDWGAIASTYERAMKAGLGGNHAEYGYARAMLADERAGPGRDRALKLLDKVSRSETGDFWRKMASETLATERARERLGKN